MTRLCFDVLSALRAKGKTLVTAESLTGGGIGAALTAVPGASDVYKGGVISYVDQVKEEVLGVSKGVLDCYGAVSAQTAEAMAIGVRKLLRSDVAVSVTGLAGPGGDDANPEGTVWIGVASDKGTVTVKKQYRNDRKRNIERFAAAALNELRLVIEKGR